jgi:uncharacterized phage-associated protein
MYYCQALHLVWYNQPLFSSRIEAWAAGPVVLDFFNRHSSSTGFTEISGDFTQTKMEPTIEKRANAIADAIVAAYGKLNIAQLNDMTQSEDPYRLVAPAPSTVVSPKPEISQEAMRTFYLAKWSRPPISGSPVG